MPAIKELKQMIETLIAHVPAEKVRRLRLANDDEYIIIVDEVAKRSKYFQAMFRKDNFAESKDSMSATAINIDLPYNETFEPLYIYLMTGT